MSHLARGRTRDRGQSLAEFALIIPIFALTLLLLFDFGRVVYTMNAIQNGAREGARLGAVSTGDLDTDPEWQARYTAIRTAARSMQPGVAIPDAGIEGCTTGDPCMQGAACPVPGDAVTGTCFYTCTGSMGDDGCRVVVEVTTNVPLITPIVSTIMGGSFLLNAKSEALVQS